MADNFAFTEGSGKTGAADDIGGVLYPRVKIAQGADGAATDVSSAAPLQVTLQNHSANATAVKTDGSAVTQPVSAAALPLPSGAATEATLATRLTEGNFDTKVGSLTETAPATDTASSGLNGRLQRIAQRITSLIALLPAALTGSGNFKVAVQEALPAGTANIGDVDVLTLPSIPAGTNNIGDVDVLTLPSIPSGSNTIGSVRITDGTNTASVRDTGSSDSLNVAIVDASGAQITSFGGGTEYTEDAAAAADPVGKASILVRADTPAATVSANGDNIAQRGTNYGAAYVTLLDSGGTPVSVGGGTQYTEDAAAASDPIGNAPILVRADTPAATVSANGDNIAQRGTNYGAAYVTLLDASGNTVSVGGGTQYTEDATAAADPIGNVQMLVRADTLAAVTTTDGDNVATRGTNKGEVYVKHVDAIPVTDNSGSLTVDNAGTFVTQENGAALTALQLIDDIVKTDDAAFTPATDKVAMVGATFDDVSPDSVNEGDAGALRMSANRNLYVTIRDAAGNERGLNIDASGQLAVTLASAQTLATVTNVATIGTSVTPGTGAANLGKAEDAVHASGDTGVMALAVRTDTAATSSGTTGDYEALHTDSVGALWNRSTGELTDDAAFTPGTSRVMPAGFMADETSTDSVDENDVGIGRMTLDRKIIVTDQPHTAGGLTMSKTVSAASTNATSVKASAGKVYAIQASNVNAAARYLKLYNKASAPTVGTDTPVKTLIIPGNTAGAGTNIVFPTGIEFTTGIAFALTTEATDAGTTAVAASEIVVNIDYK